MEERKDEKERGAESAPDEGASHSSTDQAEAEDPEMVNIRKYLMQKLKIFGTPEDGNAQNLLSDLTMDGIVEYIKSHENPKIITMAGAGISTSAGIPDFRSPNSGIYNKLDKYNLPYPQAIFQLDYFHHNPEPFFALAKELLPEGYKPTPCHYFIRLLSEKGMLLRHYTQNIDTLERIAGLPQEKLVEAHGTFHTGRCLECRAPYTLPWMKKKIIEGTVPKCEECEEGVVKPDIVFFGEMLPDRFHHLSDNDFEQADLLIIMGSSLAVQPFASLVDRVRSNCPRLLINKEKVGMENRIMRLLGMRHGLVFDAQSSHGGRDVAWLGDCDTGSQLLADKLGWGDELRSLIKKEHERLAAEESGGGT